MLANTARLNDPWLRAVVWSPNVHRFLYITALGTRDFRSLSGLMVKPANSVTDDLRGRSAVRPANDHFSGSAIVFIPRSVTRFAPRNCNNPSLRLGVAARCRGRSERPALAPPSVPLPRKRER